MWFVHSELLLGTIWTLGRVKVGVIRLALLHSYADMIQAKRTFAQPVFSPRPSHAVSLKSCLGTIVSKAKANGRFSFLHQTT